MGVLMMNEYETGGDKGTMNKKSEGKKYVEEKHRPSDRPTDRPFPNHGNTDTDSDDHNRTLKHTHTQHT